MSFPRRPRFDAGPLERQAVLMLGADAYTVEVAELLGVEKSYWRRLRADGLTPNMADRLACRLGLHPALLWPEWLADAA